MDFIKNWALVISAFMIVAGVTEMLLPSQSIKKYAKLVLGLMLIVLVIKPILDIDVMNIFEKDFGVQVVESKNTLLEETFAKKLENDMQERLKNYGELNIDVQLGQRHSITSINVAGCSEMYRKEVINELIETYGCSEITFR